MHVAGLLDAPPASPPPPARPPDGPSLAAPPEPPAAPPEPAAVVRELGPRPLGLAELVGDVRVFLNRFWALAPLVRHGTGVPPRDLLTMARVADLLTSGWLRLPHLRLLRDGVPVPDALFAGRRRIGERTVADAVDADKVLGEFRGGSTLVLEAVELLDPAVRTLCERLADTLSCPLRASAVLVPPDRQDGRRPASEAKEELFLLQISGTQRIAVYERFRRRATGPARTAPLGTVALNPQLCPGDLLYLPRGTPYRPAAVGAGHSLHLTFLAARRTTGVPLALPGPAAPAHDWDGFLPLSQILARIQQGAHHSLSRRAEARTPWRPQPSAATGPGDGLREALACLDGEETADRRLWA